MTPLIVSTDFDGTLVGFWPDQRTPALFLDWIEQWRADTGGVWILNTGRWLDSVEERLTALGVTHWPEWVGCGERELFRRIGDRYCPHEPWNRDCTLTHETLAREFHQEFKTIRDFLESSTRAECIEERESFAGCMASSPEESEEIDRFLRAASARIPDLNFMRNDVYFRFCHKNYHKGASLRELQRVTGIAAAETFAVGDHHNDLPMLVPSVAGLLACPSNAIPQVKSAVTEGGGFVASHPYDAGVVEALNHFCLLSHNTPAR